MKNMFQFVTNKKEYTLYFQDAEYTKNDFERFYLNVNVMGKEVEFLPGIFYKFDIKHSFWLKKLLAVLCLYNGESQLIKILPEILNKKFGKRIITIEFKNVRDSYSFLLTKRTCMEMRKTFKEKMKQIFNMTMNMLKESLNI